MIKYFAYGSNMDTSRMISRGINFTSRLPVTANHVKLTFNKMSAINSNEGYATLEASKNDCVEGIMYSISNAGRNKLDAFEGYPFHYQRWDIMVTDELGQEHRAMTYVAHPNKTKKGLKPSKEYLNHLLRGKDCLSDEYYEKLLKFGKIQKVFA